MEKRIKTWTCGKCEVKVQTEGKMPEYWRTEYATENYETSVPILICLKCAKARKLDNTKAK